MTGITRRHALGALGVSGGMLLGSGGLLAAVMQRPLVLRDSDVDAALLPAGDIVDLERDLVRQWRDSLRNRIARHQRAIAIVRWDKAMLLAGLGREEGLSVVQSRLPRDEALFRMELRQG